METLPCKCSAGDLWQISVCCALGYPLFPQAESWQQRAVRTFRVEQRLTELDQAVPLQGILGYLNFAGGKPDARFQKQLSDAYAFLADSEDPWGTLAGALQAKLRALKAGGGSAFRDTRQAEAVLGLVFERTLRAYREHHR